MEPRALVPTHVHVHNMYIVHMHMYAQASSLVEKESWHLVTVSLIWNCMNFMNKPELLEGDFIDPYVHEHV